MSTATQSIPRSLQPVDAALRAAARTKGAREAVARALIAGEPHRLRRAAAAEAAVRTGASLLRDAVLDEAEDVEEELSPVDMSYYRESRV